MNTHILYLKVLILVLTIFTVVISRLVFVLLELFSGRKAQSDSRVKDLISLLTSYVLISLFVLVLDPNLMYIKLPKIIWYAIGLILSPLILLSEIAIGHLFLLKKSRKVELSGYWKNPNILTISLTVSIAFFEELFFRQIWFSVLLNSLHTSVIFCVVLSSLIYAMNHFYFGKEIVFEKFASGIVFGLLFYFSGDSIVVPFIAHGMEDILILEFIH